MPSISSAYRGPLIIMGLGGGFSVVGAVPVAITFSIGVQTSATIIGMGFVTFGFLLMLPGFFWCITVRTHSFKVCWKCCRVKGKQHHLRHKNERRQKWGRADDDDELEEEDTPALCYNQEDSQLGTPSRNRDSVARERKWPPVYVDTPSLIITGKKNSCVDLQLQKVHSTGDMSNCSSGDNHNDDSVSGDDSSFKKLSFTMEQGARNSSQRFDKEIRSTEESPIRQMPDDSRPRSTSPPPERPQTTSLDETSQDAQNFSIVEKSPSSRF